MRDVPRVNARHEPRPPPCARSTAEIVGCQRVPAPRRVARAGRPGEAGGVPRRRLLGPPGPRVRRSARAGAHRRPRAAAHGGNRTGRVFTGDRSGDCLFASLHRTGFANQPTVDRGRRRARLRDAYVSAAVRCAPPANKPTPAERDRCLPFLERELALLGLGAGRRRARRVRVRGHRPGAGRGRRRAPGAAPEVRPRVEVPTARAVVLGCYHPTQQNTFTGRLTEPMLDAVFRRARELAGAVPSRP